MFKFPLKLRKSPPGPNYLHTILVHLGMVEQLEVFFY